MYYTLDMTDPEPDCLHSHSPSNCDKRAIVSVWTYKEITFYGISFRFL